MSPPMYTEMAFEPKNPLEVHLKVSENVLKADKVMCNSLSACGAQAVVVFWLYKF